MIYDKLNLGANETLEISLPESERSITLVDNLEILGFEQSEFGVQVNALLKGGEERLALRFTSSAMVE